MLWIFTKLLLKFVAYQRIDFCDIDINQLHNELYNALEKTNNISHSY